MPLVKGAFDSAFWPLVCVPLLVFGVLARTLDAAAR
jgi:hypothetical protein